MDLKHIFLSAYGRIGRGHYWLGLALLIVAYAVLSFVPGGSLIGLLLVYPAICLYAKRLHDFGKSAKWILLPVIVNVVAIPANFYFADPGAAAMTELTTEAMLYSVLALLSLVVQVGFLIWIGVPKGAPGTNRFGPPHGRRAAPEAVSA